MMANTTQFIYNLTDQWANSAIAWDGIKLNITDSGSNSSSTVLNLLVNNIAMGTVDKAGNLTLHGWSKSLVTVVGSLPDPVAAGVGARAFVTDSSVTTFGTQVANGGTSKVPVYSDGSNRIVG
jgi:hypothetical protein